MDIKIINGTIVDGTGQARYKSDIGITGDTISDIGDLSAAEAEYRRSHTFRFLYNL